jgi:NAD(P)-dependent dehydrogenase (short-subunit alcohol dehydrogenase family)
MGDFEGQVAVVTGAASGLGFALSTILVERGARVVMADVSEEAAKERAGAVGSSDVVLPVHVDVALAGSVEELRQRTEAAFGPADLVFNNAGVASREESACLHSLSEWEWVLGVNLWGVINGVRTFLPGMLERGRGHLVNVSAGMLFEPRRGYTPYCTSKWAVAGLTASIRDEVRKSKLPIGVSLVCPWDFRSGLHDLYLRWPERLGSLPEAAVPGEHNPDYWDRIGAPQAVDYAVEILDAMLAGRYWITPGFKAEDCVLQPPLDTVQPLRES